MRLLGLVAAWLISACAAAASVTATWEHDGRDVDGFRISYTCATQAGTVPAPAEARALTLSSLPDGETCSASMVAWNEAGESPRSNTVTFATPGLDRPGQVRNLRITWSESAAMPIVFSDNFNRANSGSLGANWVNVYGSPSVASNQARKGTLEAFGESLALVANWAPSPDVTISATTSGGGGGGNPAIVYGQEVGDGLYFGFLLYLGANFANLYLYDDIAETYTVAAAGGNVGSIVGVQIDFEVETTATHINVVARRADNSAQLVSYSHPRSSLPEYAEALMTPGLGFYDEASNSHWIDNFEASTPAIKVSADFNALWNLRAPVGDQAALAWSLSERVSDELSAAWSLRETVGANADLAWALRAAVANDTSVAWDLLQRTGGDMAAVWSVLQRVGDDLGLAWHQRQSAGAQTELAWLVRQLAAADATAVWDVRARAEADVSVPWSVLERSGADVDIAWDQRQTASAEAALLWAVREAVLADLGIAWDIDSATGRVGASLAVRWSIAQRLAASVDALWDVRERAEADADLRWTILQRASQELLSRWDVRERLAAGADVRWDVIARAGADLTLRWQIESEQSFPDLTGMIVIRSATSRISIASVTPGITITSATPRITIH